MSIRAYRFDVVARSDGMRVSCRLDADGFPDALVFDVRMFPHGPLAKREPNWALVALLYPAMLSGRDLVIEADISQTLLHAARGDLQGLMQACDARLKEIHITAGLAQVPQDRSPGVATGFSAGIDSFATLALYTGDEVPDSLRITCLTVHDVGAFGTGAVAHEAFAGACARARDFAGGMGLDTASIASNIDDVFRASTPPSDVFEHSHSFRNAAAAHVLHDRIGCFLYSSAHPYEEIGTRSLAQSRGKSTAYIDPILLPLLSSERLRLVSSGAALSRGQKTRLVSRNALATQHLDVCVAPEQRRHGGRVNCSRCWKCERTMATLEAIDALDSFDAVFDVPHYRENRRQILKRLAWSAERGSDIDREVLQMMRAAGLPVPLRLPRHLERARAVASRFRRLLVKPR